LRKDFVVKTKISTLPILFCTMVLSSCWTDNCPNCDFVIANITDDEVVTACIVWELMDDEKVENTTIRIEPDSVSERESDADVCSIKHAYKCDSEGESLWSEMKKKSRKKWCKKLKCVEKLDSKYWDDYNPMKYDGEACVCDY
jgi:hypothetical protein